jgi:glycosyltransferase involved in cell wall biosynthesis
MSDNEDAEVPYEPRSAAELEGLEASFRSPSGVHNYVAKAAPGWDVHGLWHTFEAGARTGYATHATSLHWMLSELGVITQLIPHRNIDIDIETFPEDRYDRLFEWHKNAVGYPHALFCSYTPEVSAEMDGVGPPIVPYIAFEGTRVSTYCRDLCNGEIFAKVWVVSEFVKSALVAGGVRPERVHVARPVLWGGPWAHMGIPTLRLQLQDREDSAEPVTPERPYTFGAMGTWQKRKGMYDLLRAYFGAFRRTDPVKLVIRTSSISQGETIRQLKERLTKEVAAIATEFGDHGFPKSQAMPKLQFLIGTDATDAEIIDWLGNLDCYANATYGEGLGIPHVWAKAQGVPMVSSTYGAVGEFLVELAEGGAVRDQVIVHDLAPVDPEICRIALMFDSDSQWGAYDVMQLSAAMSIQYERGRCVDLQGAMLTREKFSAAACLPAVREGLRSVVGDEWATQWKL